MPPLQSDGRSHGSVRHQRTSTEELRAPGAWWFSLRASGPSFGSQRSGPESASRGTRPPGEIIPEWWATSSRNGGRDHLGIGGRHHPGMRGGFTRNRHYVIRDRDQVYGVAVRHRLRAMGIRDKPIAPRSPWQNGFAERLIGSIRRECVDHLVVLGETHLRRVLNSYARYYNESRIHRSLNKDAPFPRAIERLGVITSRPVLGGLHHQYCRI